MEGSNNSTVKLSFHVKLWHCEEVTLTHQKALISKDAFKRGDLVKSLPHLCFEPMRCPLKKRGTNLRGKFTLFLLILQVCREWNWFKSNNYNRICVMNYIIYYLISNTFSWLTKSATIQWTKLRKTQVPDAKNKSVELEIWK